MDHKNGNTVSNYDTIDQNQHKINRIIKYGSVGSLHTTKDDNSTKLVEHGKYFESQWNLSQEEQRLNPDPSLE